MEQDNVNVKVRCPLCGHSFSPNEAKSSCAGCPLHKKSCGNAKCPNCGYDFPIVTENKNSWLGSLFKL